MPCNTRKGAQPLDVFVKDPARRARIQAQATRPLKDAAAVNATRWALVDALKTTGLSVETASGGRTKFNRSELGLPKTHALDAVCVGEVAAVQGWQRPTLQVKCTGRGSYQRTRLDRYGFPRGYLMRNKRVKGFATGDMVRAAVPRGKHTGTHQGRVAVRATGSFNIQTGREVIQGVSHRYCTVLQRADGYGYTLQPKDSFDNGAAGAGRVMRDALSLCEGLPLAGTQSERSGESRRRPGLKAEVSRAVG